MTAPFTYDVRDRIAWVVFDSGGMNTLSRAALDDLQRLVGEIEERAEADDIVGVILKGNRHGLGAGADIGELLNASATELEELIDVGNETLFRIEEMDVPWVAVIDGIALGGIYELALACHGIVATEKSTVGFPEIKLNIFPGLGGTQRAPRRCGLVEGFKAILQGINYPASNAAAVALIDAIVPAGEDVDVFARSFLTKILPTISRELPDDFADPEALRPMIMPVVEKATSGRPHPRALYEAVNVIIEGAKGSLADGIKHERDTFLDVASSSEGKAGMRFFFTDQKVSRHPKELGNPLMIEKVGVDGADGFMDNAILWLALEAGFQVVAHVPLEKFMERVLPGLEAKYQILVKKGRRSEEYVREKLASVLVTSKIEDLFDCDFVLEARSEDPEIKGDFYRRLGAGLKRDAIVASNSSSMGPNYLVTFFVEGGGNAENVVNLHFFSPAEHPARKLVEVVRGDATNDTVVATAHWFVTKIRKTPVILKDGAVGFLVNAGLASYFLEADKLYMEGTPIDIIDAAMRQVFPMGPFQVADGAGNDVAAGMFDFMETEKKTGNVPLVCLLRDQGRFGQKSQAGFYDYTGDNSGCEWEGLTEVSGTRGSRIAAPAEIIERCLEAMHHTARKLCNDGIVASEEECDLAFVYALGFGMHLGGPIFYAENPALAA